jgi:hypothetical protein
MAQKLLTFALTLLCTGLTANAQGGWMSRYWDGCKPSCSWSSNAKGNAAKECSKSNQLMTTSDQNRSSCDGGTSYTCWDMSPWQVDANTAYGFVASHPPNNCGACFELTFTGEGEHGTGPSHRAIQGKKLIVMASNIGGDVNPNQFDLLVPGGGVGSFDAFSNQIGVSKSDLGAQYGGLLAACPNVNNNSVADNQSCLRQKCSQVFGKSGLEWLKAGCDFYANWLMGANNPKYTSKSVSCPAELSSRYKQSGGTPPANSSGSVSQPSSSAVSGGNSSSSNNIVNRSSSTTAGGNIGNCITPPGQVNPPNGAETCIVVNGKCYKCNSARGQDCLSTWLWDGKQVDSDWWFTSVSCPVVTVPSSSSVPPPPSSSSSSSIPVASSSSSSVNDVPIPEISSSSDDTDTDIDIAIILPQAANSNVAHIQANGIYLRVMNNAKLELFDLRGKSVKKMNFSNGVHSVQLNDLPKGLYLAKVSFGSERKILRIPLR